LPSRASKKRRRDEAAPPPSDDDDARGSGRRSRKPPLPSVTPEEVAEMLGLEASDDERGGDADPDVAGSDPDFDELGDLVNRADDRTGGGGRATSEPAKSGGSKKKKKRGEKKDTQKPSEEEDELDDDSSDDDDEHPAASDAKRRRRDGTSSSKKHKQTPPVLSAKALAKANRKKEKRGVVYLGSIPPRMKPQKLRQMLSAHGALDRMYLTPEDPSLRLKRKKFGHNSGLNYVEGWVEFRRKKKAKAAAAMLHGNQMGGKRRSAHYSDLWNLRYLPGFKWEHLTEEIEYQRALREQKMQLELAVAKKERDFYLQKVEQSKQIEAMERRKKEQQHAPEDAAAAVAPDREETKEEYEKRRRREKKAETERLLRRFKQRVAIGDVNVDETRGMMDVDVLRDLFAPRDQ